MNSVQGRIGFQTTNYASLMTEPKEFKKVDRLLFTWECWEKVIALRDDHENVEVGFLLLSSPTDKYTIQDIIVPKQTVTGASVKMDPDSLNDIKSALFKANKLHLLWEGWGHSHPGPSSHPSGTDLDTYSDSYAQSDQGLMFIIGKGKDFTCLSRVRWLNHNLKIYMEHDLVTKVEEVPIDFKDPQDLRIFADLMEEIHKWLDEVRPLVSRYTYSTGNNYSSGTGTYIPPGPSTPTGDYINGVYVRNPSPVSGITDLVDAMRDNGGNATNPTQDSQGGATSFPFAGHLDGVTTTEKALSKTRVTELEALGHDLYDTCPNFDGQPRPDHLMVNAKWYDYNYEKYKALTPREQGYVDDMLREEYGVRVLSNTLLCDGIGSFKVD